MNEQADGNLPPLRALLVDDSKPYRRMLRKILEAERMVCDEAEDGAKGVQAVLEAHGHGRPFDIVYCDQNMPNMEGWEAIRELRARPPFRDLPIIVISSESERDSVKRCAQYGISSYIVKPYNAHKVMEETEKVLADAMASRHKALRKKKAEERSGLPPEEVQALEALAFEAAQKVLAAENRSAASPATHPVYSAVRKFWSKNAPGSRSDPIG